jgi:CheY-specific phosphatase CheX
MPVVLAQPELIDPFVRATQSVFCSMLASACRPGEWQTIHTETPLGELAACVDLQGSVVGAVTFHTPRYGAFKIAERITGLEPDELDELVCDSVREMANMIGGHGKRELELLRLSLGLPQLAVAPQERTRRFRDHVWIPFETDLGPCGIDVGFHPA